LRRVVVTAVGLVSPVGIGTDATWKALREGLNGIAHITHFDTEKFACKMAGEVKNFDPLDYVDKKDIKKMGRFIFFAIAAANFATQAAGLKVDPSIAERVGVYIGSGIGGFDIIEREHMNLLEGGPRRISPFFIPSTIVNLASGQVSIRIGAKGPNSATATACTTGAHAVGDSYKIIERGDADVMICGGSEASITPMGIGGFAAMRALSTRNDEPDKACRPWDQHRDGFIVGEGAGVLVLEELGFAQRRGAPILAEIVGYGMSGDAFHITSPSEDGEGATRVMQNAINDAGIAPEQIDYINAHGTSTPLGDVIETRAIRRTFGEHADKLAISSTKSMTGHLLGAAGGVEAAIAALAVSESAIPPTINLENPDPDCDLDYTAHHAQKGVVRAAMSNNLGFGGHNASLIFRRAQ
jgi:3-oxoacyl-[acyl-carrier-protein] synthase II